MASGTGRKIGIATVIMMASISLSRVIGILREATIADIGGAGAAVDAYKFSFILPEILNHVIASGFLSVTFIPIFSKYLTDENEDEGWRVFSIILTVFGLSLAVLILGAWLLTPSIIPILARGRQNPEFIAMAVRMTRIILPAQLFFFAGGLLMAVQFAKGRFTFPALAPLIYNLGIILGGIMLGPRFGMEGFAWGALAGALAGNCLLQVFGAYGVDMRFRPLFVIGHPDLRRYILLTLPLMVGLTMTFSTEIFSKIFGTFLPAGAIAWVDYAWRITMMVVAFFGQAVGVAAYPYLAHLAARHQLEEMNRVFNNTLRYLSLVLPVSALVWVLRHEIVGLLFERGKFTPEDTRMTALALAGMLIGTVAFSAQTVVSRGFYALQNTITPALFGSFAVVLSLPLYWLGITTLGVFGLGLAIAVSALLQVWVLYEVWSRKTNNPFRKKVYGFYFKIAMATVPLYLALEWSYRQMIQYIDTAFFWGRLAAVLIISTVFTVLMPSAAWVFRIEEMRILWSNILKRLKFRAKQPK
jgi:putative peptidoglycan lipid II flippase